MSALYPEISDFTGYVNLHAEQDSDQLRLPGNSPDDKRFMLAVARNGADGGDLHAGQAVSRNVIHAGKVSAIPGNSEHEPFVVRGISRENMAEMYGGGGVLEGTADYRQLLDGAADRSSRPEIVTRWSDTAPNTARRSWSLSCSAWRLT